MRSQNKESLLLLTSVTFRYLGYLATWPFNHLSPPPLPRHIKHCFQFLLPKEFKTKGNARFGGEGGVLWEMYEWCTHRWARYWYVWTCDLPTHPANEPTKGIYLSQRTYEAVHQHVQQLMGLQMPKSRIVYFVIR